MTVSAAVKFSSQEGVNSALSWHAVEFNYTKDALSIIVDYKHKQSKLFQMNVELGDKVMIGSGKGNNG